MPTETLTKPPEAVKHVDYELLRYLARPNWRGVPVPDLICELQRYQDELDDILAVPDLIESPPEGYSRKEYVDGWQFYLREVVEGIFEEIQRRERMTYKYNPDNRIIETIKSKLGGNGLVDVVSWYTQVYFHKSTWTFRCTIHGNDSTPSGVIYPDEARWWCFGCNRGGDVFDAVTHFEKIPLSEAIRKLGRHTGIDPRPLKIERKPLEFKGGADL